MNALDRLVAAALAEDVGDGDWTTQWTVSDSSRGRAEVVAKQNLVVSGTEVAERVFAAVDAELRVDVRVGEGVPAGSGDVILAVEGPTRGILTAERCALNFLGRLSGIATLTERYVRKVEGTGARVVDTRKTTPGWRVLEKAAVRAGGGANHRMGLFDMILIKDNHIAAAGGIGAAVAMVRERTDRLPIEVEVRSLEELAEVIPLEVDRVLLDNMSVELLAEAVRHTREAAVPRPELEASGNVTLDNVRTVAETGVDLISVGALTHSAAAADLSLRLLE